MLRKLDQVGLNPKNRTVGKRVLLENGFEVSKTAYFVYTNGIKGDGYFNDRLNFTTKLIPYEGKDTWSEPALFEINVLLKSQVAPAATKDCKQCEYLDKTLNGTNPAASSS